MYDDYEEYDDYDEFDDTFVCPNCGADVPWEAAACPECGSDDETGWSEEAEYNHLFRPDYDEEIPRRGLPLWQKIVSVVLAYLLASPLATLFEPSSRGFVLLTTILIVAIAYLVVVHYMGGNLISLFQRPPSIFYTRLLRRTRGDANMVERLVAFERERNPNGQRSEWEKDALRRWERDNR